MREERDSLLQKIASLNEQIELLELEEEGSALESEIAHLTVEKAISEDYLGELKERELKGTQGTDRTHLNSNTGW
jgi:hypothetical protein